ncbi:hypothetical protein TBLA_0I01460 [Henningerozyma blattae CBS 6284]|uniref:FCP1 homology domain-containing protein n=1 Tax=Henningerozyma blattae (strain ATCC 34711 / CBS 6284 / DSM 70876 / NBRC 10599 / NRRL Y-10934 / UCD 77-7) TaxID=1071380 RepID=I2H8V3_HENB6|nr:hypothetical protein TBLA_0I01460 [Tetrapisispora blattae CBS 6284]CCH62805.1 hypothetical protein TBLA_0I01460 [Tetrapisispora blattae CBS 6284]
MNAITYLYNNLLLPLQNAPAPAPTPDTPIQSKPSNTSQQPPPQPQPQLPLLYKLFAILIKPLIFLWYIFTFPLLLIEQHTNRKYKDTPPLIDPKIASSSATDLDDLNSNDEIILQTDSIKGSLLEKKNTSAAATPSATPPATSPSPLVIKQKKIQNKSVYSLTSNFIGSKNMGRFLFPKKLIPNSILKTNKRKKLILDLDETLIHSMSRNISSSTISNYHLIEVKFPTPTSAPTSAPGPSLPLSSLYYVYKRPYCDHFLNLVSDWYDLIIFTASMKEYADPVIDWLEDSFNGNFQKRLYRNHCILRDGIGYIKDLSVLNTDNQSTLNELILIDNSPISFAMNVDNAIQVQGWISDPTDTELLTLLPFLESLRHTTDVRNILALKNGERAFHFA